jgi:hypothetical protein
MTETSGARRLLHTRPISAASETVVCPAVLSLERIRATLRFPSLSRRLIGGLAAGSLALLGVVAAEPLTSIASAASAGSGNVQAKSLKAGVLAGVNHDFLAPRRVIRVVTEYYEGYVISASTAAGGMLGNPNRLVVEAHYYLRAGKCATYPSVRPQDYNDVQLIRDNMAGDYEVLCAKRNGKYITEFVPRRKFGYLPAAQHMNFAPVLAQVGNSGAESVGISAIQHGVPKRVEVNRKKHIAETDITYKKISPQPAGTRSLKEVRYYMAKGKGRVQILWYE